MSPPGESLTDKPAGPSATGPHPEGRALEPIPPGAVRYETEDVRPGPIARGLVILVIATALSAAALYPMFTWLRARAARRDPPPPPLAQHAPGRLPPEPRLQTAPASDLAAIRLEDEQLLSTYGWVDERAGIVRIPIDEAMKIALTRGLPAPTGPAAPAAGAASRGASPAPAASPAAGPSPRPQAPR